MIVSAASIDWLFIYTERSAVGVDDAAQVSTGPLSQGVTPIVQNCNAAPHESACCLDNGAMGVVVRQDDTHEAAAEVLQAYRFSANGRAQLGRPALGGWSRTGGSGRGATRARRRHPRCLLDRDLARSCKCRGGHSRAAVGRADVRDQ
ncbi:MAG: hypothetical protein MUF65_13505 [Rubritepida sp.]|jgi:2-keto-3-deoxy-L-rhamnonate aldolase RhmA|nr:hypothetical protein [Rubritepida sp.]